MIIQEIRNMRVARITNEAVIPSNAHDGDAGYDLSSVEDVVIKPNETVAVRTGLVFEIPDDYAGFVLPRSGLAVKKGITIPNSPGLIDSGYRGEIKVGLHNTTSKKYNVSKGDRIAQIVFLQYGMFNLKETDVNKIEDTERGTGGFGSSGN